MFDRIEMQGVDHLLAAELALDEAAAAQPQDSGLSEKKALLALHLADSWTASRWTARAHAIQAKALTLIANARRLEGELERAEATFRQALTFLIGPPDCPERAFYCRYLALLRQDQREPGEAAALLWRAAVISRERGQTREEGLCMAQLGLTYLEEKQFERAAPPLARALEILGEPRDAGWTLRCLLALAYCQSRLAETRTEDGIRRHGGPDF